MLPAKTLKVEQPAFPAQLSSLCVLAKLAKDKPKESLRPYSELQRLGI